MVCQATSPRRWRFRFVSVAATAAFGRRFLVMEQRFAICLKRCRYSLGLGVVYDLIWFVCVTKVLLLRRLRHSKTNWAAVHGSSRLVWFLRWWQTWTDLFSLWAQDAPLKWHLDHSIKVRIEIHNMHTCHVCIQCKLLLYVVESYHAVSISLTSWVCIRVSMYAMIHTTMILVAGNNVVTVNPGVSFMTSSAGTPHAFTTFVITLEKKCSLLLGTYGCFRK